MALGVIAKPHGIRGELSVHRYNSDSNLILSLDDIFLRQCDGQITQARIAHARPHGKAVLIQLEQCEGRDAAEQWRGAELLISRDAFPPLSKDEYYLVDLIGARVVSADGVGFGKVVDVISYPTADCVRVHSHDGIREVPLVEPFFISFSAPNGLLTVAHFETLPLVP